VVEKLLRGEMKMPIGRREETLHFVPGTLPTMTQKESLDYCYVDPVRYREHFPPRNAIFASLSKPKYNIAAFPVPKSGSSTVRYVMNNAFGATEDFRYHPGESKREHIAFLRRPKSRFFSQYDEMFVRVPPWKPETQRKMPASVRGFNSMITSYNHYMSFFCNRSLDDINNDAALRRTCNKAKSTEDGTLAHLLDNFLAAWDGLTVFDVHLRLQTAALSDVQNGKAYRLDELHDIKKSNAEWTSIALRHGVDNATIANALIRGRSYPRRFNKDLVSEESVRRVCRYAALDYCCLNYELPPECAHGIAGVSCAIKIEENSELGLGKETRAHIIPFVDESLDKLAQARRDVRRRILRRRR
jgi:hypothetical protein